MARTIFWVWGSNLAQQNPGTLRIREVEMRGKRRRGERKWGESRGEERKRDEERMTRQKMRAGLERRQGGRKKGRGERRAEGERTGDEYGRKQTEWRRGDGRGEGGQRKRGDWWEFRNYVNRFCLNCLTKEPSELITIRIVYLSNKHAQQKHTTNIQ